MIRSLRLHELGMTPTKTRELMLRRWCQINVHSYLYYHMNTNIISDHKWDQWANELYGLINKYPKIAKSLAIPDFDPSSGFDLPYFKFKRSAMSLLEPDSRKKRYITIEIPFT